MGAAAPAEALLTHSELNKALTAAEKAAAAGEHGRAAAALAMLASRKGARLRRPAPPAAPGDRERASLRAFSCLRGAS